MPPLPHHLVCVEKFTLPYLTRGARAHIHKANSGYDKLIRPARLRRLRAAVAGLFLLAASHINAQLRFSRRRRHFLRRPQHRVLHKGQTALSLSPLAPLTQVSLVPHPYAPRCTHAQQSVGVRGHQRVAPSKVPSRRLHAPRMFEDALPRPRRQAVRSTSVQPLVRVRSPKPLSQPQHASTSFVKSPRGPRASQAAPRRPGVTCPCPPQRKTLCDEKRILSATDWHDKRTLNA